MVFLDQLSANRIDDITTAFVANGEQLGSGHLGIPKHDESAFLYQSKAPGATQPVGGMGTGKPAWGSGMYGGSGATSGNQGAMLRGGNTWGGMFARGAVAQGPGVVPANPNAPIIFLVPTKAMSPGAGCSAAQKHSQMTRLTSMFDMGPDSVAFPEFVRSLLGNQTSKSSALSQFL